MSGDWSLLYIRTAGQDYCSCARWNVRSTDRVLQNDIQQAIGVNVSDQAVRNVRVAWGNGILEWDLCTHSLAWRNLRTTENTRIGRSATHSVFFPDESGFTQAWTTSSGSSQRGSAASQLWMYKESFVLVSSTTQWCLRTSQDVTFTLLTVDVTVCLLFSSCHFNAMSF